MEVVSGDTVLTCKICTRKSAKYTCPRCSINYCSLTCYRDRRHGKCSEEFYRECCKNAIQDLKAGDEQRQQIERMLSQDESSYSFDDIRYPSEGSEEESSSEEDPGDLAERLKDIDLTSENVDAEKVWKLMTAEEKREFHRLLATGNIYAIVPTWSPWWQSASQKLVTSFPDDFIDTSESEKIRVDARPLSKLISIEPHPSIVFSLAETLLGFVFVSRYFNGDHLSDMQISARDLLLKLVSFLQPSVTQESALNRTRIVKGAATRTLVFTSFSEVLASLQLRLGQNHLTCSHKLMLLLTDDLHCLLREPDTFVGRGLREITQILRAAKTKNIAIASAIHKVEFLRACVGKRDEASNNWYRRYIPPLLYAVETSICEQTMRIETEMMQEDLSDPKKTRAAGPNWRRILRDNYRHQLPSMEEINLHVQGSSP